MVIETNSGHQQLNLHGALNIETLDLTVIEIEAVNADSTIDLLQALEKEYPLPQRLHIILDNATYHYSKKFTEFQEEHERTNLGFLPPYSPELNSVERVWKHFRKSVLYNKYYKDLSAFRAVSIEYFPNIRENKRCLESLLDGGLTPNSKTLWVY